MTAASLPVLLLGGPTAVGKSEVALLLAERIHGEIVSVDSMQVYRGLDIGTAKPSRASLVRVPHHLIDVVGVEQAFDAAQFVRLANEAVHSILSRGKIPILCGGTGLYFNAYLFGLGEGPASDPALRTELDRISLDELLRELAQHDPDAFATIDRNNFRRVRRAVEVVRLTGRPYSEQRAAWPSKSEAVNHIGFGLARAQDDLRGRINSRVEQMFSAGLVEETKKMLSHGLADNPAALQALGYRQIAQHLAGKDSLAATIELVKSRTRQFAKRQMTWFRRQLNLQWIELTPETQPLAVADSLAERYLSQASRLPFCIAAE